MKKKTSDTIVAIAMCAGCVVLALGTMSNGAAKSKIHKTVWEECVGDIAYDAYVNADVGDTFDAGFDVGLLAAKVCGVQK